MKRKTFAYITLITVMALLVPAKLYVNQKKQGIDPSINLNPHPEAQQRI